MAKDAVCVDQLKHIVIRTIDDQTNDFLHMLQDLT